jgi:AraC-like DNA-binding protein
LTLDGRIGLAARPGGLIGAAMYVTVAILRAFTEGLNQLGVPPHRACEDAELDLARLADPTAMVSVGEYGRFLHAALRLSGDRAFALRVGERAQTGALHTVGHLLLSCRTMRDAIAQFVRYAELIYEQAHWELREIDDGATFAYANPGLEHEVAAIDAEFCLAFIVGVGRHFTGRESAPREVRFAHPPPPHAPEYQRVFGCPVIFAQPRNEISFKRSLLDVPYIHRDEPVAQLLRHRAEMLLSERGSQALLRQRIVDLVKYQPDLDSLDAGALAKHLGFGPRTLRRRLASLKVSLFALVEEARCELAREALAGATPLKEIANRLGYSEQSAFQRAFKRWTGMTPGQYRAAVPRPGRGESGKSQ